MRLVIFGLRELSKCCYWYFCYRDLLVLDTFLNVDDQEKTLKTVAAMLRQEFEFQYMGNDFLIIFVGWFFFEIMSRTSNWMENASLLFWYLYYYFLYIIYQHGRLYVLFIMRNKIPINLFVYNISAFIIRYRLLACIKLLKYVFQM